MKVYRITYLFKDGSKHIEPCLFSSKQDAINFAKENLGSHQRIKNKVSMLTDTFEVEEFEYR